MSRYEMAEKITRLNSVLDKYRETMAAEVEDRKIADDLVQNSLQSILKLRREILRLERELMENQDE